MKRVYDDVCILYSFVCCVRADECKRMEKRKKYAILLNCAHKTKATRVSLFEMNFLFISQHNGAIYNIIRFDFFLINLSSNDCYCLMRN